LVKVGVRLHGEEGIAVERMAVDGISDERVSAEEIAVEGTAGGGISVEEISAERLAVANTVFTTITVVVWSDEAVE
jgi:hypothetical protein